MKKLTSFAALLLLAACGSDDSQPVNNITGNLIGKWHVSQVTYNGAVSTWMPCSYNNSFDFSEDGKCVTEEFLANEYGDCELAETINKTYTLDGNDLTITHDNGEYGIETDTGVIQELTSDKLVLSTYMYNHPDELLPYVVTYAKVNN
jgi:hypothetical protein